MVEAWNPDYQTIQPLNCPIKYDGGVLAGCSHKGYIHNDPNKCVVDVLHDMPSQYASKWRVWTPNKK